MRILRGLGVAALIIALVVVSLSFLLPSSDQKADTDPGVGAEDPDRPESGAIIGRVVSVSGEPVAHATVNSGELEGITGSDGRFRISLPSTASPTARWVLADHEDFLPRARAALPGRDVIVRLTPDDGRTIAVTFTGDVMFGRRFFDPNEDGDTSDAILSPDASAADHAELFRYVEPLISTSDLTVINLETPLIRHPYLDPTLPRRRGVHPTKEFVLASSVQAADGLRRAGVDVVDLGNNHLYDALDKGVTSTVSALEKAGFTRGRRLFGGGASVAQATRPAVVDTAAGSIAFIGCTSISAPTENGVVSLDQIRYVADDSKGGAALCDPTAVAKQVRRLRQHYDVVVVQIHGGYEYDRSPSPSVREVTGAALRAGASLVMNHHPHVVGGLHNDGTSLVAWTLGNFLFDQTVWPTFESYIVTVNIRDGKLIRAYTEPLLIENYVPHGVVASAADLVAREAAGQEPGPWVMEDGSVEALLGSRAASQQTATTRVTIDEPGLYELPDGVAASSRVIGGRLDPGRDLLWVGGFEDEDVGESWGDGPLWNVTSPDVAIRQDAALDGSFGARLRRASSNCSDVFLSPIHRILVDPGTRLSVVGALRSRGGGDVTVQLSWYPDTKGTSREQTLVNIPDRQSWKDFIVDTVVPDYAVAVGLYVRLAPPVSGTAAADVDNLAVVAWSDDAPSALHNYLRVTEAPAMLPLTQGRLPGSASPQAPAPMLVDAAPSQAPPPGRHSALANDC